VDIHRQAIYRRFRALQILQKMPANTMFSPPSHPRISF
jgi:hypothetical protein